MPNFWRLCILRKGAVGCFGVILPNVEKVVSLRVLRYIFFVGLGAFVNVGQAQVVDEVDDVIFDNQSSALLVEYLQTHDMLNPNHGISLRIYANGRVEVDLPSINPRAGSYEMDLSVSELDALVAEIIESNIAPEVPVSSNELTYISDSTRTYISVFASGFSTRSGVTNTLSGPIRIQEADLGVGSSRAANARSSGGRRSRLGQVERQLLALTADPRLRRN